MSGHEVTIAISSFLALIVVYSWMTTERFKSTRRWNQIQRVVNDARDDIELSASRQRHPAGKRLRQKI